MEDLLEHDSLTEAETALTTALDDGQGRGYGRSRHRRLQDWSGGRGVAAEGCRRVLPRVQAGRRSRLRAPGPQAPARHPVRRFRAGGAAGGSRQFHVGYGDADTDLLLGNPLYLRPVLGRPDYRGIPVVLLHECYPYTRQGGYLAAVYENVYLDLSYGIPLLGYAEMLSSTRQALGVAPSSKLMYSSDGIGVPELHWNSAIDGRRVLGESLGEMVSTRRTKPPRGRSRPGKYPAHEREAPVQTPRRLPETATFHEPFQKREQHNPNP